MTKAAGDAVLLEHGHARQGDELELHPCPRVSKSRQDQGQAPIEKLLLSEPSSPGATTREGPTDNNLYSFLHFKTTYFLKKLVK